MLQQTVVLQIVTGFLNKDVNNVLTYKVTSLLCGSPYFYRVKAYNTIDTSSYSNIISGYMPSNSTGDTSVIACSEFTWYGNKYLSSCNPTHVLYNAAGCDSTVTLHLTIQDVTNPVPDVTNLPDLIDDCSIIAVAPTATDNCAGTIYASTIDSLFYFSEGTHTIHWTYDDGNGNSSSQTQKVIINYGKTFGDSSAIVCNSFNWYGIEYTESGTPTHTIKNKFGCDSIITLSLTITTCTGINNNKISNINIYPSPVNNEFVIENKGNTQVLFYEIFNSI